MGWVKISEELYSSDQSNFSLEKIDGIWYVIDNSRQAKSIPFTDIFNNPVFPVDFSNVDLIVKNLVAIEDVSGVDAFFTNRVFAKHFQAESADTPNTPALSFQGDLNSGIYRISEDKIGFSAGGSRQGEFGIGYGGFTGNIIQVVSSTQNFKTNITGTAFQNINSASGVVWETSIIPKLANSKIFILFTLAVNPPTNDYIGFRLSSKINASSYSVVYNPEIASGGGAIDVGVSTSGSFTILTRPILYTPTYTLGDTITHKIEGSTYSPGVTGTINRLRTGTGANSGHSEMFLFEIAG